MSNPTTNPNTPALQRSNTPRVLRVLDTASLAGMALGVALMLQPWWPWGIRAGFFTALGFTVLQMIVSHIPRKSP